MFGSRESEVPTVDTAKKAREVITTRTLAQMEEDFADRMDSGYESLDEEGKNKVDRAIQDLLVNQVVSAWKLEGDQRGEMDQKVDALKHVHQWMSEERLKQRKASSEPVSSYREAFIKNVGEFEPIEPIEEISSEDVGEQEVA